MSADRDDRLTASAISRRMVLGGLVALPITACTSISPQALNSLGSKVDKAKVDFPHLNQMARRADDSQRSEAEIRGRWPNVTKVGQIPAVGVRYVVEQDHGRKAQYLSMPGMASRCTAASRTARSPCGPKSRRNCAGTTGPMSAVTRWAPASPRCCRCI
ncbi:hypothetical protein VW23_017815 [Devosia insulae DS-56]|uniref:Uncharacterized protein n=1 Tax=Devosia insulae DS-56 TaxID=1116389 RepID=A0A1E5XRA0_9HYPH|nr:hypothetical protein [Devosia insulae]OEO31109.1 hypothetical protein VW23_017815 [Devosia insulae DS-56]